MVCRNIVFLSEYSENNVKLGNVLCKNGIAGYWLADSPINYDKIKSNCGSLFVNPKEEAFKTFVSSFIWDLGYSPDVLIVKGQTVDFWAVASLIQEGVFDFPCVSLLDDLSIPLDGFDLMILDQFDKNIIKPDKKNLIREYFDIFRKELLGSEDCNIMRKIEGKIFSIKEFSQVFGNDIEDRYFRSFVKEFKSRILNEINRGKRVVGDVII